MDKNNTCLENKIAPYARCIGYLIIAISIIIMYFVFMDLIKTILIIISFSLFSYGTMLVIGKPIKEFVNEKLLIIASIYLSAFYIVCQKDNDKNDSINIQKNLDK